MTDYEAGFASGSHEGRLSDSNPIARRIAPIHGKIIASPEYIREHGAPEAPDQVLDHECLVQGTETWHFIDGDRTIPVHPQGRFKANSGTALAAAAVAGLGIARVPVFLMEKELASGALVALMNSYPLIEAGFFIVRPPGPYASRKVQVLAISDEAGRVFQCESGHLFRFEAGPPFRADGGRGGDVPAGRVGDLT